jgi:peptidoglycan/xylan/chitin deacetylase (PgdA/CDA1 family)
MVASHTWSHADLATLNADQITSEMQRVDEALQRLLGVTPAFMRPPYGSYNDLVSGIAGERGQTMVLWDFDSGDSRGSTEAQIEQAYDALAGQHPSNVLALNHEIYGAYNHSSAHRRAYKFELQQVKSQIASAMLSKCSQVQVTTSSLLPSV